MTLATASKPSSQLPRGSGFAELRDDNRPVNAEQSNLPAAVERPDPSQLTAFDLWAVEVPNLLGWPGVLGKSAPGRRDPSS